MNHQDLLGGGVPPESGNAAQSQQIPEQQSAQSVEPGIGAQLAAQREARGWSIEQVASQLNLAVRQIQALEQDNFAALPGMASVRGFIRAYAKLLKIDAAPLVAMLAVETVPPAIEPLHSRRPLTAPFSDARHLPPNGARASFSKPVLAAVAAGILLIGGLAAYQFGWLHIPALQHAASEAPSTATASAVEPAGVAASAPVPEEKPVESSPNQALAAQGNAPVPSATTPANTASVAPAPSTVSVAPPTPTTPPVVDKTAAVPRNPLVLKMREDSWLEIRRAGASAKGASNVLMSRLERAGTTETFDVTEPVVVTVGNVGGVDATLRGEPVDLKRDAKNNVAHLNLK